MNNLVLISAWSTVVYAHSHVVSSPCVHIQFPVLSQRRRTRLIESNAKCRHLRKLTCKGTLQQVFICLRPRTPYLPPRPYTLYTCIHTESYSLIHQRKGGREGGELNLVKPERRREGQQFTKLGRKYQLTDCISSVQNLINTYCKGPLQVIF
jgi:hypothetical protein